MTDAVVGLGVSTLILVLIIWFLPIFLILRSSRTGGLEKLIWILLLLFFSWFSWILYLLLAPVAKNPTQ